MAHNFQNTTLSLTLPISCQICLGKVRQPVICANYHVFCSNCMEMWLKKASQCPTCRVPITAENPCREIIGHTNESDESQSMKKRLRKTRGELLLREYEDEIEGLLRENEELKTKNQTLDSQLTTVLDPCTINAVQGEDNSVDPSVLEEWTNKLRAATDLYNKVKQDMKKLKEANKTLRSQNVDLVQENMQLKAEVASRSPQKFGRYTVAALEAKIQQYERDVDHLKRALERSDQYIEDLETSRVSEGEKRPPDQMEASRPYSRAPLESTASGGDEASTEAHMEPQKISMMKSSLSDAERESICDPEVEGQPLPDNCSFLFAAAVGLSREFGKTMIGQGKDEDMDSPSSQLLPSTPSSAFRSLTLKSPGVRSEKKVAFKPLSYQRRLSFEDVAEPGNGGDAASTTENKFSSLSKFPKGWPPSMKEESSKPVFWEDWQSESSDQPCPGPSKAQSPLRATSQDLSDKESVSFHMSSEASMDAAYLDKISELDSMMLDGESSSSRGSHLSLASSLPPDRDGALVPEPKPCPEILTDCGGEDCAVMGGHLSMSCVERNWSLCDITDGTVNDSESPAGTAETGASGPFSGKEADAHVLGSAGSGEPSQTDELSFDLLFDPLVENTADPSGSLSPADQSHDHQLSPSSSTSGCHGESGNTRRDRQASTAISQPTKRKSHSPFNTSSPTKLSKLM